MPLTKEKLSDRAINSNKLILCEGEDEYDLLVMLRDESGLSDIDVKIATAKGRSNIERRWELIQKQANASKITTLAIIFDSEQDPVASNQWAEQFVAKYQTSILKVIVHQLPSSTLAGSIETLIRSGLEKSSLGFDCATQWEACVQANEATAFSLKAKQDKAWLRFG